MNTKNFDKKILIVRTSALGDIFQCFPVIAFLKSRYEKCVIDWVVEERFVNALSSHPDLRRILLINTRAWRKNLLSSKVRQEVQSFRKALRSEVYDMVFDLQGNIKSGLITKLARAKEKIGWAFRTAPEWPSALFLTNRYSPDPKLSMAEQYLSIVQKSLGGALQWHPSRVSLETNENEQAWIQSIVSNEAPLKLMICIGSTWENKRLSLKMWKQVLDHLYKTYNPTFYFVAGTKKELEECAHLSEFYQKQGIVLPKMKIAVWQKVIAETDGLLTVDSSALHLAASTPTPTFSFFGASSERAYRPIGQQHHSLQGPCPYGVSFKKRCPRLRICPTGACLKDLSEKELIPRVDAWMEAVMPIR